MPENKNDAYRYLDAPLPIQTKEPVKTQSLFDFVVDEPGELKEVVVEGEELHQMGDKYFFSKKNVHQIGESIVQLFRNPIYQAHCCLNTSNNYCFASCKVEDNGRCRAWQPEKPLQ